MSTENTYEAIAQSLRQRLKSVLGTSDAIDVEKSTEYGASLRETVPLEKHAIWKVPEDRPDPVELLRSQGTTRVQQLLPLRYERMSASPFTFYRGAALIMASDLSTTPVTKIKTQICGDAHISNFGLFLSPERRTVFDINDFDETVLGPWEWDVKRLAASVEICGRDNGFSKSERKKAVRSCVSGYREAMATFASMNNLDMWYAHLDVDALNDTIMANSDAATAKAAKKITKKSKGKNNARAVRKLTEIVDGKLRIVSNPPLIVPMRDIAQELASSNEGGHLVSLLGDEACEQLMGAILTKYRLSLTPEKRRLVSSYMPVDMAHKVVGVGSVGTRAWIIVLRGASEKDALVLQVKEAQESVLERFLGPDIHLNHAQRVVEGQHAMQTASDSLLGWCRVRDVTKGTSKDYYVRQLWDGKGSIDLSLLNPSGLSQLAQVCGWTLAHAHARTGDRFAISSYLGTDNSFDKAIAKFARAYADQNEADYARFMEAYKDGTLIS